MNKIALYAVLFGLLSLHFSNQVLAQGGLYAQPNSREQLQKDAPLMGNYGTAFDLPASVSAKPLPVVSQPAQRKRAELQAQREQLRAKREETLVAKTRSERALSRMSDVGKFVQNILASQDAAGGIGDLVREVAREQAVGQATISAKLDILVARQGLARWIFGHDQQALQDLGDGAKKIDQQLAKLENELDYLTDTQREVALDFVDELKYLQSELISLVEEKSVEFSLVNWIKGWFEQTD